MVLALQAGQYIADSTFYSPAGAGPWGYYGSPWNPGGLVAGVGYVQTTYCPTVAAGFPVGTHIFAEWPNIGYQGVRGQQAISYGNYLGTFPDVGITARQINNITTLNLTHALTHVGDEYNILYDVMLTLNSGDSGSVLFEIEIMLHAPLASTVAYIEGLTNIGTTTISGISWRVTKTTGGLVAIFFLQENHADILSATIDFKAMLNYLVTQGQLAGTEYYNGHNVGPEPINGNCNVRFNVLSVSYA